MDPKRSKQQQQWNGMEQQQQICILQHPFNPMNCDLHFRTTRAPSTQPRREHPTTNGKTGKTILQAITGRRLMYTRSDGLRLTRRFYTLQLMDADLHRHP